MKNKTWINNKKSQIPSTLTWVVAFLIIFFIMLLFIASTSILAKQRKIKITESDIGNQVTLTRDLMRILDTPASDGQTVKELIKKWDISEGEERAGLRQEIVNSVKSLEPAKEGECYIFSARNRVQQDVDAKSKDGISMAVPDPLYSIEFHNIDSVKSPKITSDNKDYIRNMLLKKAVNIYLISNNGNIKISFYAGGC